MSSSLLLQQFTEYIYNIYICGGGEVYVKKERERERERYKSK